MADKKDEPMWEMPVEKWWVDLVRARVKPDGPMLRKDLAAAVGCDAASITNLLNRNYPTSKWVMPVSRYLGIPAPYVKITRATEAGFLELLQELSAIDPAEAMEAMENLRRKVARKKNS